MRLDSSAPSKVVDDETILSTTASSTLAASDKITENLGMATSATKNLRSSLRRSNGSSVVSNLRVDLKKGKMTDFGY
jgi:hypothetical protein